MLTAGLTWREVTLLRAYAKYLRQGGMRFSEDYVQRVLRSNAAITRLLIRLFESRFDPARQSGASERCEAITEEIRGQLDEVTSLDADRILRSYLALIDATLRTNYYKQDSPGPGPGVDGPRPLVLKLDPGTIPGIVEPRPKFEIFVFSPRLEAVHLRFGRVARGGLRWSDRLEDFRTEVLGLVKAQEVKNAVIVPAGAKGGFVCKRLPDPADREAYQAEVLACYKTFIAGMLDVTDNIDGDQVVPPPGVVRRDGDDPYLVVAADKGTATFSDTANEVAGRYGFWLGDAFASGGSEGYDHKKMGITARGAWESVKWHFAALGLEPGHGRIHRGGRGRHVRRRVRQRDAALAPRQAGGGLRPPARVHRPVARSGGQLRRAGADVRAAQVLVGGLRPGADLARRRGLAAVGEVGAGIAAGPHRPRHRRHGLRAVPGRADLRHPGRPGRPALERRDRHLREGQLGVATPTRGTGPTTRSGSTPPRLRARVVGEGGNLGFTQAARIEYSLGGGLMNTDFIDNSAGVDTSDHEVNIKILLADAIRDGAIPASGRHELLNEMTGEVAEPGAAAQLRAEHGAGRGPGPGPLPAARARAVPAQADQGQAAQRRNRTSCPASGRSPSAGPRAAG